jgi:hypothetical protein
VCRAVHRNASGLAVVVKVLGLGPELPAARATRSVLRPPFGASLAGGRGDEVRNPRGAGAASAPSWPRAQAPDCRVRVRETDPLSVETLRRRSACRFAGRRGSAREEEPGGRRHRSGGESLRGEHARRARRGMASAVLAPAARRDEAFEAGGGVRARRLTAGEDEGRRRPSISGWIKALKVEAQGRSRDEINPGVSGVR